MSSEPADELLCAGRDEGLQILQTRHVQGAVPRLPATQVLLRVADGDKGLYTLRGCPSVPLCPPAGGISIAVSIGRSSS